MPDLKTFKVNSPALMASMSLITAACFHKGEQGHFYVFFFSVPLCLQPQLIPKMH